MRTALLLADLRARGVTLMVDGDGLRYRAPRGVLTDADRAALQAHKAALLEVLRREQDEPGDASYRGRLRTVHGGLSDADRARFDAEVGSGDPIATLLQRMVAEGRA